MSRLLFLILHGVFMHLPFLQEVFNLKVPGVGRVLLYSSVCYKFTILAHVFP